MMIVERFKMGFPGRGRSVGGQLDAENRGTLRLNRDQNGGVDGENLIAEVKHHRFRGHRRSEEHTSELQSLAYLVCRLLLEKKKSINCATTRVLFGKNGSYVVADRGADVYRFVQRALVGGSNAFFAARDPCCEPLSPCYIQPFN